MTPEETALHMQVLEERIARLGAIPQVLLEAIREGTAEEVAAGLCDAIREEFEQTQHH
jgi:hypothetical protein